MAAPKVPPPPPPPSGTARVRSPLGRFIVTVLVWLPVTFAVWYLVSPALMWIVRFLCSAAALPFGDLVRTVEQSGSTMVFVTSLKPGQAAGAGVISVSVDGLLYAFGMPMFAALTLAAREPARWKILALGIVALLPFVTFGIVADFLKNVAITSGPLVASQAGFSSAQREMIAFAYQFGTLILPTVVPAIVWVLTHRAFLERMRGKP
ncbi:MAG: exosortase H-associated membrane protein [Betaproteobacteria bacterium]